MDQMIHATFVDGVFKPVEPVDLPAGSTVRLIVTENAQACSEDSDWEAFERMADEYAVPSLPRLSREQLHDRRV